MADISRQLHEKGVALFRKEQYETALQTFEEALSQAEENAREAAEIYNDIGVTYRQLDDYKAAHRALDEAMTRFIGLNDRKGQAQTLGNRASVYEAEGMADKAIEAYKESAKMFEDVGESEMAMYVWQAVSRLRMKQGEYVAAIGAYEEGVENMPQSSLKRKFLQKILRAPGSILGLGGGASDEDDEEEEEDEQ